MRGFVSQPTVPAGHRAARPAPMSDTRRAGGSAAPHTETRSVCALDTKHKTTIAADSITSECVGLFRGFFNRKRERRKKCFCVMFQICKVCLEPFSMNPLYSIHS